MLGMQKLDSLGQQIGLTRRQRGVSQCFGERQSAWYWTRQIDTDFGKSRARTECPAISGPAQSRRVAGLACTAELRSITNFLNPLIPIESWAVLAP
jgi:hypothetical protein